MQLILRIGFILILILSIGLGNLSKGQGLEEYGQNRLQFENFEWKTIDTSHFRIFFYGNNKRLATLTANIAEDVSSSLAPKLKVYIDYKSNIVLYSSFNQYVQSNINSSQDQFVFNNAGKIKIAGSVYVIYFDGDLIELRNQIRREIVRGTVEKILYGNQAKNLGQSIIDTDIPFWYTEGFISYTSDSINELDVRLLESYKLQHPKFNLYKLAYDEPVLAGKFFWSMVYNKFGDKQALQLLQKSVGIKSYVKAIKKLFGKKSKQIRKDFDEYCEYILDRFKYDKVIKDTITPLATIPGKQIGNYDQLKASPLFDEFMYVKKSMNSWKVQDIKGQNKVFDILEGPIHGYYQESDPHDPLLIWSHNGQKLGILYLMNGSYRLKVYNSLSRTMFTQWVKKKLFERITYASFSESSNYILMSVVKRGQSDIVVYNIKQGRSINLTNDEYSDLEPIYLYSQNHKGMVWKSNRGDQTYLKAPKGEEGEFQSLDYNLYYKNSVNPSDTVQRLTYYTNVKISKLSQLDDNSITFLLDSADQRKRMVLEFIHRNYQKDTFRLYELPSAEYILDQQYITHNKTLAQFTYGNGKINMSKIKSEIALMDTLYDPLIQEMRNEEKDALYNNEEEEKVDEGEKSNFFMSEFYDESKLGFIQDYTEADSVKASATRKKQSKISSYVPNFKIIQGNFSFNNTLLINKYQSIESNGYGLVNPTLDAMMNYGISDVLENYEIIGGFKFNPVKGGSDVFIQYKNKKKYLDWSILGYRRSALVTDYLKSKFYYLEGNVEYPISAAFRMGLKLGVRQEQRVPLMIDTNSLKRKLQNYQWLTGEYDVVYDNSYTPEKNIWKGQKVRLFAEFYQNFKEKSTVTNFGLDAREYMPIYRNMIWASRISIGASYGNSRILYFLGGVPNQLVLSPFRDNFSAIGTTSLNNNFTTIDYSQNYKFQTQAAPLRGVPQNVRNGNGYMLFNTEIRMPYVSTFTNRLVKSKLLNSLQMILFCDAGLTWTGNLPETDNIKSSLTIPGVPPGQVTVILENPHISSPVGFGTGFRASVWGYFGKIDFAWNTEQLNAKPFIHLSLGTDF